VRGPARHFTLTRYMSDGTIDLGNEPPLSLDHQLDEAPVKRAVSMRWLGGTILTGLTSIFLMGGALTAALDNPNQFASLPEALADLGSASEENAFGQKSDRIQPVQEEIAERQILQVSTVTRQGERDFIKLRPFAKILATLGTPKEEFASKVPPYDVMRIFADTSAVDSGTATAAADGQISDTAVDGEVSVKVSPLPLGDPGLATMALDTGTVEQVVRAAAKFGGKDVKLATAMAYAEEGDAYGGDGDLLGTDETVVGADGGGGDPFSALGVKIQTENVSSVAKSDIDIDGETVQEKVVSLTDHDDLETILTDNNMPEEDAVEVEAALKQLTDVKDLGPGNKIRIAYTLDPLDGVTERPLRVSVYEKGAHQATVARADASGFVRADEPEAMPEGMEVVEKEDAPGAMPKLYDAVYQTALEQEVPAPLVDQLVKIFAFDVDFQSRIAPGDTLEVFHSMPDPNDRDAPEPEILYASLKVSGATKRFYRFRTSDDGYVDYYDEDGKSAKKFLMRKPLPGARISSSFGYRRHPILRRSLLHTGVDYGGRGYGAPILAAGNGIVEKAGRASGYGNLIVLRHTNGYETYYGHQQSFAKGIAPGVRVRQGQVIGYVGSTGQSTGPHLHFEIRINNKPVDPLRIRLPEGRVLEGDLLASFENERSRIDTLLGNQAAPTTVAAVN
jgi:murein DD-endopeptidase MepM/ murein hydrolase activator NlpD